MTVHQGRTHRLIRLTPDNAAITLFGCSTCYPEYAWRAEQKLCPICGRPGCPRDHVPIIADEPRPAPSRLDQAIDIAFALVGTLILAVITGYVVHAVWPTIPPVVLFVLAALAFYAGISVASRWIR